MITRQQFMDDLGTGAAAMGVRLEDGILERFFRYQSELERWNSSINLVSRREPDWIRVHFLDSLAPVGLGFVAGGERLVDLGAGAGFPGVPLKLAEPGLSLDLAEASGKKCAWLRHLLRVLGVEGAAVLEGRFEVLLEGGHAGSYDLAVARAVAKPVRVLKEAKPFLRPGGRLLVYTTKDLAGKSVGKIHPYKVPGSKAPSVIWEVGF